MLKQRLITGIILVILVVLGVLFVPNTAFAVLAAGIVLGIGGWEWAELTGLKQPDITQPMLFIVALLLFALGIYLSRGAFWPVLSIVSLIVWGGIIYLLMTYHQGVLIYQNNKWLLRFIAFPVLLIAWLALVILHDKNSSMLLYLILLVAAADSSAYFAGKRFGVNKLAPNLSPGKTMEGMMGAMLGATLWAIIGAIYFGLSLADGIFFVLLSVVTATLSIAGDLFESLIKREANQKDSGTILPGHGGILDRIDAQLAALPFFTAGVMLGGIV